MSANTRQGMAVTDQVPPCSPDKSLIVIVYTEIEGAAQWGLPVNYIFK